MKSTRNTLLPLLAALALAVNPLACHAQTRPAPPPPPVTTGETKLLPKMSPEEIAHIKNLLFADTPLVEFLRGPKAKDPDPGGGPGRLLEQAVEDMRRGRPAEARRKLKQVLSLPDVETRALLLTWNTLRELGERPPPGEAGKVRGVVMELHNEAGVGTVAAYADGSVRWIGGQGKVTILELRITDAEIGPFVRDFHKAAEPIVKRATATERHRPGEPPFEHFRVSVLTYGGIHVVELYGPGVDDQHFAGPLLLAGGRLVEAVLTFEKEHPAR